jgi:hypothetical protein
MDAINEKNQNFIREEQERAAEKEYFMKSSGKTRNDRLLLNLTQFEDYGFFDSPPAGKLELSRL